MFSVCSFYSFAGCQEVFFVLLDADEVPAHIYAGDTGRAASHVGIDDDVSGVLWQFGDAELHQFYRFLCWVLFLHSVSGSAGIGDVFKNPQVAVEGAPA